MISHILVIVLHPWCLLLTEICDSFGVYRSYYFILPAFLIGCLVPNVLTHYLARLCGSAISLMRFNTSICLITAGSCCCFRWAESLGHAKLTSLVLPARVERRRMMPHKCGKRVWALQQLQQNNRERETEQERECACSESKYLQLFIA